MKLRTLFFWAHLTAGLTAGIVILTMSATGVLLTYERQLIEWADRVRARRGVSYGDQAQFFRREWLARVGGFPDQPIMEDVELSLRLRVLGRPVSLDVPVTVSARRFADRGWWRVLWANWRFRRAYRRRGLAACREIYERYYRRPWPCGGA